MKKYLAILLTLAALLCVPAMAAGDGTVYRWETENLCTGGDFEFAKETTALPRYDTAGARGADLTATGGWFSNPADLGGSLVPGEGVNGSVALKLAGDNAAFGAAYWLLPVDRLKDKDVINVSFLYKTSETFKTGTPQVHAHITRDVYQAGDPVCIIKDDPGADVTYGFESFVGTPVGDGWYRITGSVACETLDNRCLLRLFADFRKPDGFLGADAWVLFDDVQVGVPALQAEDPVEENRSSVNLITGGDFEERKVGEAMGTDYDETGWGSTVWDYEAATFVRDGSMCLQIAGTNRNAYGCVNYKLPKLTAGRTYRLEFDYKFLAETGDMTSQAHFSICSNAALQAGNAGGWLNVSLIGKPGDAAENGFSHVAVDLVADEWQVSACTDLRIFVQLGNAGSDFGVRIDNVALYDIANEDPLPEAVQAVLQKIAALGNVDDLTEADKANVQAAYDAYAALTAAQKAMIPADQVALLNSAYAKLFAAAPTDPAPADPTPSDTVQDDPTDVPQPPMGESGTPVLCGMLALLSGAALLALFALRRRNRAN